MKPITVALLLGAAFAGCGNETAPGGLQVPTPVALSAAEVELVIARATAEAQVRGAKATVAVVDRVGNVLGLFKMNGAATSFAIDGDRGGQGGLEGADDVVPSELAAIAKAITAAYFSSAGNAFSTRTAGQIIQEHFSPGELRAPAGPLFGVQFSQLTCSDVSKQVTDGSIGPKRSPLGFAADPGGLPLYKNRNVVGAIGVISDGNYSIDREIEDVDIDEDELIAVAGTYGLQAPIDIRADHITADGRTLRFTDSEQIASTPATAPAFAAITDTVGMLVNQLGYGGNPIVAGTAYGTPESGIRPDTNPAMAGTSAYILVDAANNNRYPPTAGMGGLDAAEVTQLLRSALEVANQTRAQVRRPVGSVAQVSAVVVDLNGDILGYVRSPDALVDSVDVVVQKARTAVFFSSRGAAAALAGRTSSSAYLAATRSFLQDPTAFDNGTAYSTRAVGGLAQPFFPDGIDETGNGPLAKPYAGWSIFSNGLELDLVLDKLLASLTADDRTRDCTGIATIRNGITLFGGGLPIYRGSTLVGAIGVSGDGTEQSDLIAFLGIQTSGQRLGTGLGNAPQQLRADNVVPKGPGTRLRYVACPPAPFNGSSAQNVCDEP